MKTLLIVTFLILFSASLQKELESPDGLNPAHIYCVHPEVKEGENVTFKCKVDHISEGTVHVYLFKNNERVKMSFFAAHKTDDTIFNLTKVTVEHSGSYTCLYSKANPFFVNKLNATGHNSISLEVYGEILPAKIIGTETDALTLTCTFTVIQNCTQVYVYLCLNGIGNSKKRVNCGDKPISTAFLSSVTEEHSGNYSCVYSASNYKLSEVNKTGENSIFIQVYDLQWKINLFRILCSVGVIIIACCIVIFDIKTRSFLKLLRQFLQSKPGLRMLQVHQIQIV